MGKKLFDFVIGNPPYQSGDNESNSRQEPVYQHFYESAESLGEKYMLISPARFLFNAGLTSKEWNKKMLSDEHLKVEKYVQNGNEVFPNTDIKGGVAVIYHDDKKNFGAIETFIPDENLREIAIKVRKSKPTPISEIMHGGRSDLLFNNLAITENPQIVSDRLKAIQKKNPKVTSLAKNEEFEIKSSAFDVLPYMFHKSVQNEILYYRILGLSNMSREWRWVEKKYVYARNQKDNNLNSYKVLIPKASGTGKFGEALSEPIISAPNDTSTPTFISMGKFSSEFEAKSAVKYICSKFCRTLLGILKITQDIVPSKWLYVPLQDFTSSSDIDWSKSVHEIDLQLYKKYGLSDEEISFIETNVKEMA